MRGNSKAANILRRRRDVGWWKLEERRGKDASATSAATRVDASRFGQRLLLAAKASRRPGCRKIREMGTPVKLAGTRHEAESSREASASANSCARFSFRPPVLSPNAFLVRYSSEILSNSGHDIVNYNSASFLYFSSPCRLFITYLE